MDREQIRLKAFVANPNNDDYLETIEMGTDPITIGQRAADILLSKGGAKNALGHQLASIGRSLSWCGSMGKRTLDAPRRGAVSAKQMSFCTTISSTKTISNMRPPPPSARALVDRPIE